MYKNITLTIGSRNKTESLAFRPYFACTVEGPLVLKLGGYFLSSYGSDPNSVEISIRLYTDLELYRFSNFKRFEPFFNDVIVVDKYISLPIISRYKTLSSRPALAFTR